MDPTLILGVLAFGVIVAAGASRGVGGLDAFAGVAGAPPTSSRWPTGVPESDAPHAAAGRWARLLADDDTHAEGPVLEAVDLAMGASGTLELEAVHDVTLGRVTLG